MTLNVSVNPRYRVNAPGFAGDFDATAYVKSGAARVRERLESNGWTYVSQVIDDMRLTFANGARKFGGMDETTSIFALAGRDNADLRVRWKGRELFRGDGIESDSSDDLQKGTATVKFRSLASRMDMEDLPAGVVPADTPAMTALDTLLGRLGVSYSRSLTPLQNDDLIIASEEGLIDSENTTTREAIKSILQLNFGALTVRGDTFRVGRRFAPALSGAPLVIGDLDIVALTNASDGSAAVRNRIRITGLDGREITWNDPASISRSGVRAESIRARWCEQYNLLAEYARELIRRMRDPRRLITITISLDGLSGFELASLRIMQRVRLDIKGFGSGIKAGFARIGDRAGNVRSRAIAGDFCIVMVELDLTKGLAKLGLQERFGYDDGEVFAPAPSVPITPPEPPAGVIENALVTEGGMRLTTEDGLIITTEA